MTQQSTPKKTKPHTWLFKIIAAMLPLLLFVLLELLLRLFNYGDDLSVFIADKSLPEYMVLNPHLSGRYFNNRENATMGNTEPFAKIKPANTLRLFVLGESTTIGFPYMHNGAFHRWLKYRLLQTYPGKNFEIINLSLTAVNSFTVRDIAKALPNYQPDGILIYCGHNEYYGAMGVASTSSIGNSPEIAPVIISLKQLRIVQLAFNLFTSSGKTIDTSKNLMERMVANRRIPLGSVTYKKGIANFAANMDAVCKLFSDRQIPVFLSTVVSNERDVKPFIDDDRKDAARCFNQGQATSRAGDTAMAKIAFRQAKEYDQLRFRAPEEINSTIRQLASKYPLVKLVDTRKLFEMNSPQGIIGNNLVLEHVHPNLAGYALMSDAFYTGLLQAGLLSRPGANALTLQQLKVQMPVTITDSCFGAYAIALLKQRWPFNETISIPKPRQNFEQSLAYDMAFNKLKWNDAMDQLMSHYEQQNNLAGMLKIAEAVMLEFPLDPTFYLAAGDLCLRNNQKARAENYLSRSFALQPNMQLAQKLFAIEMDLQHLDNALRYVNYGLNVSPGNSKLANAEKLLQRMIAIVNSQKAGKEGYRELAGAYQTFGQQELAEHYRKLSIQ